jgi:hypothetical protein
MAIVTPNRADMLHYKAVIKALDLGRIRVNISFLHMNKQGSPVYNPWENLVPLLTPIFLSLIIMFSAGIIEGIIFLILGILMYLYLFRIMIAKRLNERVLSFMRYSYLGWQTIWDYGGVSIISTLNPKLGSRAPDDDWKKFVALNLSDLMTDGEKKSQKNRFPWEEEDAKEAFMQDEKIEKPQEPIERQQPHFRHPDFEKDAKKSYVSKKNKREPLPEDVFNLDGIVDLEDDE